MPSNIERAAVIGCGSIGASFAALFIANNIRTSVYDPNPAAQELLSQIIKQAFMQLQELPTSPSPEILNQRQSLVTFTTNLEKALQDAEFVQENGPERLDIKLDLLQRIDASLPSTALIATSTSGLTCTSMQPALLQHPERFLVGHPFNPPHLIPLIEVVGGDKTTEESINRAMHFYTSLGKKAIHVKREIPGHIANRLQAALAREMMFLIHEGVATAEDIDIAMEYGPGLRWGVMGPSALFHLGGGQGGAKHFSEHILVNMMTWYAPKDPVFDDELREKWVRETGEITKGVNFDEMVQQRDRELLSLLKIKQTRAQK